MTKSQGTSKAGEMDWEGGLEEMIENNLVCDKCTGNGWDYDEGDKCKQCHGNGVYEWKVWPLVSEVRKIIQQAIAQERKRIAEEVGAIRMPYPNPYGEYVRVPKVNRIIDRIIHIITNNHE